MQNFTKHGLKQNMLSEQQQKEPKEHPKKLKSKKKCALLIS